ncbi:millepora cytotoxin-1-like isoform X2 [Halichondria panicea]
MEISASLVCVCLLVLLSTLVTKSVGSKDVVQAERDTERDIVHIQQRPLMERGSAQIWWPHEHWGKKKHKPKKKPVRRKPPPRRVIHYKPRRVIHPRPKPKWHPPKNHPQQIPGFKQKFDLPLHTVCDSAKGEGLIQVKSKYDGYYGDRVWDWKCHKVAPSPLIDCSWSPYINNWKQDITYMCPKNKFMAGIRSHHMNAHEDRKWKIRCCGANDYHTEDCLMTEYVNMLHGDLDHKVGSPCGGGAGALVGLDSHYKQKDRRWRIFECSVHAG